MIILTRKPFIGPFIYHLNGYITKPGYELPFIDERSYNQPILLAKHFNQLRRDSVKAGFNAGSGSADVGHCLITQFILLGHPDLPHLEFIPQPPREQCYTQPEDGHRCQRRLRARTYTYQVSGYIIDSSYPQSFTELIPLDTPLLSGKDFFQMMLYLRELLLGADHQKADLYRVIVSEFDLLYDPVYDLSDVFHSTVARCSDGLLRDNGICVASS
ncbi:hypothetical protein SJS76_00620 [Aeromonas caviae]|uniref:hypothetical protein n=1 Tax=Aeromonas caviae TaxID=648 RepID=UPI000F5F8764|nr:hypothetical protein [Aeromonas caviae]MDX7838056.1 hypothetical protein [Aeromonas caviae]RQX21699.1 hypothetical protein EHZ61_13095 [Aeromonas caviae]